MNEEYRYEEPGDARVTPATLPDAGGPTASTTDLNLRVRETEPERKDVPTGGVSTINGSGVAAAGASTVLAADEQASPLFSPEEAKEFRARWDTISGGLCG